MERTKSNKCLNHQQLCKLYESNAFIVVHLGSKTCRYNKIHILLFETVLHIVWKKKDSINFIMSLLNYKITSY